MPATAPAFRGNEIASEYRTAPATTIRSTGFQLAKRRSKAAIPTAVSNTAGITEAYRKRGPRYVS